MDDKDVIIAHLMQRIESLLEKIQNLEAENLEFKECIARLEKNSATSSKPPSSDIIHPQATSLVRKKKPHRGGQQGHPKHSRQPFPAEAIDETIVHKLSDEK
jgi:transposase